MRRKNSLIIPAVLAFSLCTVTAVPVLAEDAAQTEAEADTASDEASDAAEDTAVTPYEKGTITSIFQDINEGKFSSLYIRGSTTASHTPGWHHPCSVA